MISLLTHLSKHQKAKIASPWPPRNFAVPLLLAMPAMFSNSSGNVCVGDVFSLPPYPLNGMDQRCGFCCDAAAPSTPAHQAGQRFPSLSFSFSLSFNQCSSCHLNPAVHQKRYCAVLAATWAEREDFAGKIGLLRSEFEWCHHRRRKTLSGAWFLPAKSKDVNFNIHG